MPNNNDSLNLLPIFNPVIASGIGEPRPEGIDLNEVAVGTVLKIQTGHHSYRLENRGNGNALISGHPEYCPQPVAVQIHGSIDPTGHLQWQFIGKGMKLVFLPPDHGIIRTSRIEEIQTLGPHTGSAN